MNINSKMYNCICTCTMYVAINICTDLINIKLVVCTKNNGVEREGGREGGRDTCMKGESKKINKK